MTFHESITRPISWVSINMSQTVQMQTSMPVPFFEFHNDVHIFKNGKRNPLFLCLPYCQKFVIKYAFQMV